MQKYSQKWAVASFFDDLTEGFEFHRKDTPLHATLAGVFAMNLSAAEIVKLLEDEVTATDEFMIVGNNIEMWGDTKVTTLVESQTFNRLFNSIQSMLLIRGAVFNEPQYLNKGFRPHVTFQKSGSLQPEESKKIINVCLVDLFPNGNFEQRRIIMNIPLRKV